MDKYNTGSAITDCAQNEGDIIRELERQKKERLLAIEQHLKEKNGL